MTDGRVGSDLPHLEEFDSKYEKACLRSGDIVLTKMGVPPRLAVAEIPDGETVIATGNLYIIRLDTDRMNPYFVAAFLSSENGRELIERRMAGTTIPTLSLLELKNLEIPELPFEVQDRIAKRYQAALDDIEILKLKIEKAQKNNDTITRTIRISGKTFDRINELAEKNDLSFNNVINQIIEYGLENLEEK